MAPARATFTRLMAVVVLLSGGYGTSVALHRCPHHHGTAQHVPVDRAPVDRAPVDRSQVEPTRVESVHGDPAHGESDGSHESGHDTRCTCVGECCGSAVSPLASTLLGSADRVPAPRRQLVAAWPGHVSPRPAPSPYFHSFANPPPAPG